MGSIKKQQKRLSGLKKYNRIVSTLVKDRKKKGEAYQLSEIRQLASSLYPNFKETPLKGITKKGVLSASPKKLLISQRGYKKEKAEEPEYTLPSSFTDLNERYYYDLADLIGAIETQVPNDVYFVSQLAGSEGVTIQGGTKIEPSIDAFYTQNFQNLVAYLDKQRNLGQFKDDSGGDFRIVCTPAVKDKKNNRWISQIVMTDPDGNEFGSDDFDPDASGIMDEFNPNEKYASEPSKITAKKTKTPQTPSKFASNEELRVRSKEAENIEFQQDIEAIKLGIFGSGTPEDQKKAFREKWTKRGRFNA
jgi:hypothetical protein